MRDKILLNLENPGQLEKLYQENKPGFRSAFNSLYPDFPDKTLAEFWHHRLHYDTPGISWGSYQEILLVIGFSLIAGLLAKIPALFPINEEFFYPRNLGFLVFPFLIGYFAWKHQLSTKIFWTVLGILLMALVYINALPDLPDSDILLLVCIHLPLLLWILFGFTFTAASWFSINLDFLRFNGELIVMCALLVLAGIITSGVTIGLFSLIGFSIEQFYMENILIFGLPAIPIVATYLTCNNPQLVDRVSPVIAKIFSPVVLVMLVIYLGAILFTGKDPYNDREFLLLFNLLLIGVMALIFFSVAERTTERSPLSGRWLLFLLSLLTIVVNGIALSAIVFRISEWGITPNRLAVLGANILMLIHLVLISLNLLKSLKGGTNLAQTRTTITRYIPVYLFWIIVVIFLFPLFFGL